MHTPFDDSVCALRCPAECDQDVLTFRTEISTSEFPTRSYAYKLANDRREHFRKLFRTENITFDMVKKSTARVFIHFEDLAAETVVEFPSIVLIDLVANLGGILGLFTGASILSFVEIFTMSIQFFVILANQKFKNHNNF